jgi:hypothetical protein
MPVGPTISEIWHTRDCGGLGSETPPMRPARSARFPNPPTVAIFPTVLVFAYLKKLQF